MKIILINYPYKDHEIGDVLDLGEEKNKSMVSMHRAVWAEEPEKLKKKKVEEATKENPTSDKTTRGKGKKKIIKKKTEPVKLMTNKLKEAVQDKKKEEGGESFWDKIK